jgi:syntaxin 6
MDLVSIREQDQDLDELSASVERLGGVGLTIHDELISQVPFLSRN